MRKRKMPCAKNVKGCEMSSFSASFHSLCIANALRRGKKGHQIPGWEKLSLMPLGRLRGRNTGPC